ncbi:MAG: hypothetical protein V1909_06015 [Candidatus Micrarchaeota archaeon]
MAETIPELVRLEKLRAGYPDAAEASRIIDGFGLGLNSKTPSDPSNIRRLGNLFGADWGEGNVQFISTIRRLHYPENMIGELKHADFSAIDSLNPTLDDRQGIINAAQFLGKALSNQFYHLDVLHPPATLAGAPNRTQTVVCSFIERCIDGTLGERAKSDAIDVIVHSLNAEFGVQAVEKAQSILAGRMTVMENSRAKNDDVVYRILDPILHSSSPESQCLQNTVSLLPFQLTRGGMFSDKLGEMVVSALNSENGKAILFLLREFINGKTELAIDKKYREELPRWLEVNQVRITNAEVSGKLSILLAQCGGLKVAREPVGAVTRTGPGQIQRAVWR